MLNDGNKSEILKSIRILRNHRFSRLKNGPELVYIWRPITCDDAVLEGDIDRVDELFNEVWDSFPLEVRESVEEWRRNFE